MPQTKLFNISLQFGAPVDFPGVYDAQNGRWEIYHPLGQSAEPLFWLGRDRKLTWAGGDRGSSVPAQIVGTSQINLAF
jgi:hypothetical protein